jgi:putative DNA primase/helicase
VTTTTREQTNVADLAEEILKDTHIAKNAGGRLYVFREGVYKPNGEPFIRERVKSLHHTWELETKWTKHRSDEVIEYIRVDAPELWTDLPVDTVNVLNGLLDVKTRKLRPHSPEFLTAVQLPVMFDPAARCPAWDKFIAEVFPIDSEAIAWEIPAWLMTAENSIQKAVLLLGEGSNGKSTYLRACVAFIGKSNTAALSLHKLEQDKFAAARLVGKLANICPDLPTGHLASTMMFKALTGGDVLSAEYKFRDSFEYVPICKLIFSANKPPQSDDATHGFFRRWQVVPFEQCFEEGDQGTVNRAQIDAALSDPQELSGVLNKALEALPTLRKGGFTQSESMRRAWDEFRTATDPLAVWLDHDTVQDPNVMVAADELVTAFNLHMSDAGKQGMSKTAFGLAIKRLKKDIEVAQRTYKGKEKVRVYLGIALKTEREAR